MPRHNDQISDQEYLDMRKNAEAAIKRLTDGLKYGLDMKSSAMLCFDDAASLLGAEKSQDDDVKIVVVHSTSETIGGDDCESTDIYTTGRKIDVVHINSHWLTGASSVKLEKSSMLTEKEMREYKKEISEHVCRYRELYSSNPIDVLNKVFPDKAVEKLSVKPKKNSLLPTR